MLKLIFLILVINSTYLFFLLYNHYFLVLFCIAIFASKIEGNIFVEKWNWAKLKNAWAEFENHTFFADIKIDELSWFNSQKVQIVQLPWRNWGSNLAKIWASNVLVPLASSGSLDQHTRRLTLIRFGVQSYDSSKKRGSVKGKMTKT